MCHVITHCSARAQFIVGDHCESVFKPSSEGGNPQVHLRKISQVPIWHIQLCGLHSSGGCYDHLGEVQTSVCV